jgi:hypothetical protein
MLDDLLEEARVGSRGVEACRAGTRSGLTPSFQIRIRSKQLLIKVAVAKKNGGI